MERRRIAGRPEEGGNAIGLERLPRDDPGRDARRKILGQKRAQRLVLPRLDVARRPVINQANAEQVLFGVLYSHRIAELVSPADEESDLRLVVEHLRRAERRGGCTLRKRLTTGPRYVAAAEHDRR